MTAERQQNNGQLAALESRLAPMQASAAMPAAVASAAVPVATVNGTELPSCGAPFVVAQAVSVGGPVPQGIVVAQAVPV